MSEFIYLASQSPRRQALLDQLGVAWQLLQPGPEEDSEALERPLGRESAQGYVARVTLLKCVAAERRRVARALAPGLILCADTTVTLDGTLFGKPADAAEASAMLRKLSGRSHRVLTAVALSDGSRRETTVSITRVRMGTLTDADIAAYVASGEALGKAGAYAIQGRAAAFITHLSGSHSGVVGLPLHETAELLKRFGFPVLRECA